VSAPECLGIPNGAFGENTWLLWDGPTRQAVVVDPGEEAGRIVAELRRRDLTVGGIWLTHAHVDHIWGVDALRVETGAPVFLHPADREWYDAFPDQLRHFGLPALPAPAPPDRALVPGEFLAVGPWRFAVRHVPGHSPGHVAFIGHGLAFTGDVLFLDSIGRTDFPGCSHAQLLESIRRELLSLPDETRVLPGHGPETTIGRERRHNPFLAG
jgi:glyoxylase-like metal-dependent hydrolase (beta-lactamase superfamily II)